MDEIDCYGDDKQSEICAVNNDSYFKKKGWTILLQGLSININKKQKWNKLDSSAEVAAKEDEEDKQMQKKLEETKAKSGQEDDGIDVE